MRIAKVKLIPLKNEYLNSFEGQDKLINIVEGNIDCNEQVEYGEGDSNIGDIAVEAYYEKLYSGDDLNDKNIFHDFFLGFEPFQYSYSRWELELKVKNPTKEQIEKHIVNSWYYEIDPGDAEEIENIDTNYAYSYHDSASLRHIPADRVKEIISDFDKENILSTAKNLEKILNSLGIFVDKFGNNDMKLIDDIEKIFKKAAEENTGIAYIVIY